MKKKYLFLFVFIYFLFINLSDVYAAINLGTKATINGTNSVIIGNDSTANISIDTESKINSCTFNVLVPDGITLVSKSGMNNFIIEDRTDNFIVKKSEGSAEFTSGMNILELKFNIMKSGTVIIKTIECTDDDSDVGSYSDLPLEYKAVEDANDTSLKSLSVTSGGVLSPDFSTGRKEYILQLNNKKFGITYTTSNSTYQNKVVVKDANGNTLDPNNIAFNDTSFQGSMEVSIIVNGDSNNAYRILASYEAPELDNELSKLIINGKEIELMDKQYDYNFKLDNDITNVKIDAVLKDSTNFKFSDDGGPRTIKLSNDTNNTVAIIIIPSDNSNGGKSLTYKINLIKDKVTSSESTTTKPTTEPTTKKVDNIVTNPTTGENAMLFVILILITSLFFSIGYYGLNYENK